MNEIFVWGHHNGRNHEVTPWFNKLLLSNAVRLSLMHRLALSAHHSMRLPMRIRIWVPWWPCPQQRFTLFFPQIGESRRRVKSTGGNAHFYDLHRLNVIELTNVRRSHRSEFVRMVRFLDNSDARTKASTSYVPKVGTLVRIRRAKAAPSPLL